MKKIGDIMAEMGFRKDAPDSVKEAFIKHLIHAATGVVVETPSEKNQPEKRKDENPVQLSFNFDQDQGQKKQKVS